MSEEPDDEEFLPKVCQQRQPVSEFPSLVKYSRPTLVVKLTDNMRAAQKKNLKFDSKKDIEELLNKILPPICWEDDDKLWQQTLSSAPAKPEDLIKLKEDVDLRLKQTGARETGNCPIRREIYSQLFDELIRQITITCSERGLLLLRARDEYMTMFRGYNSILVSAAAFVIRKTLQGHCEKRELNALLKQKLREKEALEKIIVQTETDIAEVEQNCIANREEREKSFKAQLSDLRKTLNKLKVELEQLVQPKTKV